MTLADFVEVTKSRIPTPQEFVAFVDAQGWKFAQLDDGRPALKGTRSPLIVSLARMLGREPYRTNVLALVCKRWHKEEEVTANATRTSHLPSPRLRQWLWKCEAPVPPTHRYQERPDDLSVGNELAHPGGAFWWRWCGETDWRFVPNRGGTAEALPIGETMGGLP